MTLAPWVAQKPDQRLMTLRWRATNKAAAAWVARRVGQGIAMARRAGAA